MKTETPHKLMILIESASNVRVYCCRTLQFNWLMDVYLLLDCVFYVSSTNKSADESTVRCILKTHAQTHTLNLTVVPKSKNQTRNKKIYTQKNGMKILYKNRISIYRIFVWVVIWSFTCTIWPRTTAIAYSRPCTYINFL